MAAVFSTENMKMKDADRAISLFNQIINEQKDFACKVYFSEKYLQEKEPQKYNGKNHLIMEYIQNIKNIDKEFRVFVEKLGKYQRKSYNLKKERNPIEIKKEVEDLLSNNEQNVVKVFENFFINTLDNNMKNCKMLETVCQDNNLKNFERFLLRNTEILKQHVKQNIIVKNMAQPRQ